MDTSESQTDVIDNRSWKKDARSRTYLPELIIMNTDRDQMTQVRTTSQFQEIPAAFTFNISPIQVKIAQLRNLSRPLQAHDSRSVKFRQPQRHPDPNRRYQSEIPWHKKHWGSAYNTLTTLFICTTMMGRGCITRLNIQHLTLAEIVVKPSESTLAAIEVTTTAIDHVP